MNKQDGFKPTGHLTVYKVYPDDREDELVFSEHNTITSGLSLGLSILFANQGSQTITDYQIRWFQLGVDGDINDYGVSTSLLGSAIESEDYYQSAGSKLIVDTHKLLARGVSLNNRVFAEIPFYAIQKTGAKSIRFTIGIDRNSCNTTPPMDINEIGLFMSNPRGLSPLESILVAYRPHSVITKTSDFGLLYKWEINF